MRFGSLSSPPTLSLSLSLSSLLFTQYFSTPDPTGPIGKDHVQRTGSKTTSYRRTRRARSESSSGPPGEKGLMGESPEGGSPELTSPLGITGNSGLPGSVGQQGSAGPLM